MKYKDATKCGSCRYWLEPDGNEGVDFITGSCVRLAPVIIAKLLASKDPLDLELEEIANATVYPSVTNISPACGCYETEGKP